MSGRAPTRVVMIGGGYATLHAYRALTRRRRGSQVQITVVSADDRHNFHGFTGEVVAGLLPLEVTRTPLTAVLPRADFLHGQVVRVDLTARTVLARPMDGGELRRIPFDELVVSCGGREPLDAVPGMERHGFTLRAPGEFGRFLARLSSIARQATPIEGTDGAVVVVGGGMAGVELAAAAADRLGRAQTRHPVVLVQSGPELLPGLRVQHPAVAARAERELARLGVAVRTGVGVKLVGEGSALLTDGSWIKAAAVLATTGQRPVAIPGLETLPHDRVGRLITDPTLQVAPRVWSAGDVARVRHPRTGAPVAANALWAIKAGGHLGGNLSRVIGGRRPRPFGYRGLGQAMGFGIGRSATELYGLPIPGVAGWILRLAFFLRFMPSRRRAAAVVISLASLPFRGRFVAAHPTDPVPDNAALGAVA